MLIWTLQIRLSGSDSQPANIPEQSCCLNTLLTLRLWWGAAGLQHTLCTLSYCFLRPFTPTEADWPQPSRPSAFLAGINLKAAPLLTWLLISVGSHMPKHYITVFICHTVLNKHTLLEYSPLSNGVGKSDSFQEIIWFISLVCELTVFNLIQQYDLLINESLSFHTLSS